MTTTFNYDEMSTAELCDDRLSEIRTQLRKCSELGTELFKVRDYGRRADEAREARHQAVMSGAPSAEWPSRRKAGAMKAQRTKAWDRAFELDVDLGYPVESPYSDPAAQSELKAHVEDLIEAYKARAAELSN